MLLPEEDDRARNINSRISTGDDANNKGNRKLMEDVPGKEEEDQNRYHDRSRGEDCSPEAFIDTFIENRNKVCLPHLFDILSDPVKNDNRIVN